MRQRKPRAGPRRPDRNRSKPRSQARAGAQAGERRGPDRPARPPAGAAHQGAEPAPPPPIATGVQTMAVTPDEAGMRVDRFLEAKFPGLSFSHIQRVIRKGELRVNGKRVDGKDRLRPGNRCASRRCGSSAEPAPGSEADAKTRAIPQIDHALRGRRRAGAQQADGARGAGRLRHGQACRRHARQCCATRRVSGRA